MADYQINAVFDEKKNRWVVSLTGEFDVFNSNDLKEKLKNLFVGERCTDVLLDCAKMTFIDSTALGALVAARKTAVEHTKKIYVSSLKDSIRKLFRLTSLDKLFEIEGEADE